MCIVGRMYEIALTRQQAVTPGGVAAPAPVLLSVPSGQTKAWLLVWLRSVSPQVGGFTGCNSSVGQ
jgi:hypothetical protein